MRLGRERPRKAFDGVWGVPRRGPFNEAGARTPQKGASADRPRPRKTGSFNEAGARTPQKVRIRVVERIRLRGPSMRLGRERPRKDGGSVGKIAGYMCLQ